MIENTTINVSNGTIDTIRDVGRKGESYDKIILRLMEDYKNQLEGRTIVYKELGYMITFEDESGLVMIRDLDREPIRVKHMLKLVNLIEVSKHNESKRTRKKKKPEYIPNLFVREPTLDPDMSKEDRLVYLGRRRAVVMGKMSWLMNENKDYSKLVKELPELRKEVAEIDTELIKG